LTKTAGAATLAGRVATKGGWWELAGDVTAFAKLTGERHFDMVVAGAGFAGLACAHRLAELHPSASIALIEAGRVGAGNSGLNSGFLLDISFYDDAAPHVQAARTRLQRAGLATLRRLVGKHDIDCGWQDWGNLYGAVSAREEDWLDAMAQRFAAFGEPAEPWDMARMRNVTGSPAYRRGLFHPGTALVQPVKLVRGWVRALPASVQVFEMSPVRGFHYTRDAVDIDAGAARMRAGKLFLCVNGGLPDLGISRGRLVKVSTFAAMTAPLPEDSGAIANVAPFGVLPSFSGGATLRKTDDNRLLVRQGYAFTPAGPPFGALLDRFAAEARTTMLRRWPQLEPVSFQFLWSGVMALTRNTTQVFGEVKRNVFATAFCNGAGNTAGTAAGTLLAEHASGHDSALLRDQLSFPAPAWVPPDALLGWFVQRQISAADRRVREVYEA
jgi:glycine/D-amino acid oxidase-like deaminating enzyme